MTATLNGITYLEFEFPMPQSYVGKLEELVEKHGGFARSFTVSEGGFFSSKKITVKFLIPQQNIFDFNIDLSKLFKN